jgi:hypothetical protein
MKEDRMKKKMEANGGEKPRLGRPCKKSEILTA